MEGLAPIRYRDMRDNLFVNLSPNQPFIALELESKDMFKIDWIGDKNCYVNHNTMVEDAPSRPMTRL